MRLLPSYAINNQCCTPPLTQEARTHSIEPGSEHRQRHQQDEVRPSFVLLSLQSGGSHCYLQWRPPGLAARQAVPQADLHTVAQHVGEPRALQVAAGTLVRSESKGEPLAAEEENGRGPQVAEGGVTELGARQQAAHLAVSVVWAWVWWVSVLCVCECE